MQAFYSKHSQNRIFSRKIPGCDSFTWIALDFRILIFFQFEMQTVKTKLCRIKSSGLFGFLVEETSPSCMRKLETLNIIKFATSECGCNQTQYFYLLKGIYIILKRWRTAKRNIRQRYSSIRRIHPLVLRQITWFSKCPETRSRNAIGLVKFM